MADITVSAAGVQATATTLTATGTSAAAITAGQPVYMDASTSNNLRPALAGGIAAQAAVVGIALNSAPGAGQPVRYATGGLVTFIGTTFVVGGSYNLSANSGNIAPVADTTTGNYVSHLGEAPTATTLQIALNVTGITHA